MIQNILNRNGARRLILNANNKYKRSSALIQQSNNFNKLSIQAYQREKTTSSSTLFKCIQLQNRDFYFFIDSKHFHSHTHALCKDPESNAEKTANLLKDQKLNKKDLIPSSEASKAASIDQIAESIDVKKGVDQQVAEQRLTLWERIVKELKHYYHGFKLLYFETKIAYRLLRQVLSGHTLTRRERKQFTRTAADLFRLVPFSVFIIVPFMEFTLPIFLKLFPNMLPSTFQEQSKEQENLKKKLKAKLEMAKFLQDTLEDTALKSTSIDANQKNADVTASDPTLNQKFATFMKKVRTQGEQPTNEDIMKFSSLFENELTVDNLTRQQLIALCKLLDVNTLGNIPPIHILRFLLSMKIRNLEADDIQIIKEGTNTLDVEELQTACRDRGMPALGLSEEKLRLQLEQWLDLHINRKIPLSLLVLSRTLYLPINLSPEDLIKTTISVLPQSIENATLVKVSEISGEKIDNKIKLELLKQEEVEIKLEKSAIESSAVPSMRPEPTIVASTAQSEVDLGAQQLAKETLVDKAKLLEVDASQELLTPKEIKEINQIIESLPSAEKQQVVAEIDELKKDVSEYKEDVREVEQLTSVDNQVKLTETKSAKILSKRVQKMINELETMVEKLDKEQSVNVSVGDVSDLSNKNIVSINELMVAIKKVKGTFENKAKEDKLLEILKSLDVDKDGKIDDINDVLKVFDLIEQESVKVTKDQLGNLLNLLEKEKLIELEEQKKAQSSAKQNQT